MFVIRRSQMDAFAAEADGRFKKASCAQLRQQHGSIRIKFPEGNRMMAEIEPDLLAGCVNAALQTARNYGLSFQSDLFHFITLMFAAGPKFHEQSGIHRVLTDSSLTPHKRMIFLFRRTTNDDWDEAQARYEPSNWADIVSSQPKAT
jgi:hypothetical protein